CCRCVDTGSLTSPWRCSIVPVDPSRQLPGTAAGQSSSRETDRPGSCRDFRQAFVAGLNLTADVTLVKNFTKTRRHPSTPLRFGCGPAATRKIARQQESSPPRGGDAPRSQSCNFSSTRAESFGHTGGVVTGCTSYDSRRSNDATSSPAQPVHRSHRGGVVCA